MNINWDFMALHREIFFTVKNAKGTGKERRRDQVFFCLVA